MAAEFRHVDVAEATARLDILGAELGDLTHLPPAGRAQRLVGFLDGQVGLRMRPERDPEGLMLDRVLADRSGHPLALAVLHVAIARRSGLELFPVACGDLLLLADRSGDRPVVIDPVPGGRRLDRELGWVCPHVVAKMLLDAIGSLHLERGDLPRAIRAAELRLKLPLDPRTRERHLTALRGLHARLN